MENKINFECIVPVRQVLSVVADFILSLEIRQPFLVVPLIRSQKMILRQGATNCSKGVMDLKVIQKVNTQLPSNWIPTENYQFSVCTSPIMHLVCPPTILHKHCLQFLLGAPKYTEEIKDKGYEKLWEKTRRIMGDMQIANKAANVNIV